MTRAGRNSGPKGNPAPRSRAGLGGRWEREHEVLHALLHGSRGSGTPARGPECYTLLQAL